MTDDCRQFPLSGHAFFSRQLHVLLFLSGLQARWYVQMSSRCVCCGCRRKLIKHIYAKQGM